MGCLLESIFKFILVNLLSIFKFTLIEILWESIEDLLKMGCLQSIFKFTLINLLKMGCLLGEYFIEDGFQSIFKFTLINLWESIEDEDGFAYGRVLL